MKVKLSNIINSKEAFQKLSTSPIKASLAFDILSVLKLAESEFEKFESIRLSKVKEYGAQDEAGTITVSPENVEKFNKEMGELLESDISITCDLIKKQKFLEDDSLRISTEDLYKLTWALEE